MPTNLLAMLLISMTLVAFAPRAAASACDVGDTDDLCIDDANFEDGSCSDAGGWESHVTYVTVQAAGKTIGAMGARQCSNWGSPAHAEVVEVAAFGNGDDFEAGLQGRAGEASAPQCLLFVYWTQAGGPVLAQDVDPSLCAAVHGVAWGDLVP